jgi:hypothetical protein
MSLSVMVAAAVLSFSLQFRFHLLNRLLKPAAKLFRVALLGKLNQDRTGAEDGRPNPAVKEEIVGLGLRFQLPTQYTSFVAVEQRLATSDGQSKTVVVPVEMPADVSYKGVFGTQRRPRMSSSALGPAQAWGAGGGVAGWEGSASGYRRAMLAVAGGSKATEKTVPSSLAQLA